MDDLKKKAWNLHKTLKPLFKHLSYGAVLYALRKGLPQKDTEELIKKLASVARKRNRNRRRKNQDDKTCARPCDGNAPDHEQ